MTAADHPLPSPPLSRRLLADLATGYAATLARIGWWAAITAVAFRHLSAPYFAALVVTRSAVTILNYFAMGLGPATVHALAHPTRSAIRAVPIQDPDASATLSYHSGLPDEPPKPPTIAIASSIAYLGAMIIIAVSLISVLIDPRRLMQGLVITDSPLTAAYRLLVMFFAISAAVRLIAEPLGALLQWRKRIAIDNLLQLTADSVTGVLAIIWLRSDALTSPFSGSPITVGLATLAGASLLLILRVLALPARDRIANFLPARYGWSVCKPIARFAALIALAQLADYLYAPTDYLLINHLLTPAATVAYTPAVQIDSGLLLLVSAVGTALLPRFAAAHANADHRHLRRMYFQSTALCALVMIAAVAIVLLTAKPLLTIWYGQDIPATRAVLPLVLLNTIIGGSSAPARALLLAIGRARAYTTAALIAGAANVIASFSFVYFFHLGLAGIVLGTVLAVSARCGIWMPWFTLRAIRQSRESINEHEFIPIPSS